MDGKLRRGPVITLDPVKEKDLLELVDSMSYSRKLGVLVTHLIRLAFESPEVYGNGKEVQQLIAKMNELGMTPTRYKYFEQVAKEVEAMKCKVDAIYDMAYKTYTLALMNKYMGIGDKSDNTLRASFILEQQITKLCETLGVSDIRHTYASNKLEDTHKKANTIFEYIIESYDSIVEELKSSLVSQVVVAAPVSTDSTSLAGKNEASTGANTQVSNPDDNNSSTNDDQDFIELTDKPVNDALIVDVNQEKAARLLDWAAD